MKRWVAVFLSRIFRVLTLDRKVFVEIYADPHATLQSFILVLLVTLTIEIGLDGVEAIEGLGIIRLLIYGTVVWIVGASLAFILGRFVLPRPGTGLTPPSVARAITYAQAPGLIAILGLIPHAIGLVFMIGLLWELVTTAVAFKQAFVWSVRRAIAGVILYVPLYAIITSGIYYIRF